MDAEDSIRRGQSTATDSRSAARELHGSIAQENAELILFFCSSEYDLDALADEMNRLFAGVPVVGCTSAGEIGPSGYRDRSLSGISFPASTFTAVIASMDDLANFNITEGQAAGHALLQELRKRAPDAGPDDSFAFLLIDGLSVREEQAARAFQNGIGKIRLFGGSAGDDVQFKSTWVFHDGAFHPNASALILVNTSLPFKIFRTQHFVCEEERLVVTEADAARRIVKEINGLPAAAEYARLVGVAVEDLSPSLFANSPVVVVVDGTDYVRSIQKMNEDGSLTFFSAIDEGLVFRVARGVDLLENLNRAFADLRKDIGPPQLTIACDCILRNLEITQRGLKESVGNIMRENNAVGFSTYGEQIDGVHVNQTLTGIAIGFPRA
ncbi:MAG: FIST domain containing protein [Treponema sp. GWB1_62_6]|nr:MAG: FIST domain containing protein [Treponema sp. GWC1_61_84]OHE69689.1 MAG: FIST domain containing protein [Treponema sp. GWB1_62_6]OHE75194.1 MAG: FIST domain containing protein [Treponema sp. RIFOXYC1_FULL_61_9]HCM28889.1 FIST domain containing protein [Treponema sp.]